MINMRLINVHTLGLEEFVGAQVPKYAILSHTWGDDEVGFQKWQIDKGQGKDGFKKIEAACYQAKRDKLGYLWCDTNCIDKSSSAELSEAINSMFNWYRDSVVCYAYLVDVQGADGFRNSRWFSRGWTLQELLAPVQVVFFNRDWDPMGSKVEMRFEIAGITGINSAYLKSGPLLISAAGVAERMSWLSRRQTTRIEDMAYCMLGIFDLNLPLLYGEGHKAFIRLQEEIIRVSDDHTIFCWSSDLLPQLDPSQQPHISLIAPSPLAFAGCGHIISVESFKHGGPTYAITNAGLSIQLPASHHPRDQNGTVAVLRATSASERGDSLLGIPLKPSYLHGGWIRDHSYPGLVSVPMYNDDPDERQEFTFVPQKRAFNYCSWLTVPSAPQTSSMFQCSVQINAKTLTGEPWESWMLVALRGKWDEEHRHLKLLPAGDPRHYPNSRTWGCLFKIVLSGLDTRRGSGSAMTGYNVFSVIYMDFCQREGYQRFYGRADPLVTDLFPAGDPQTHGDAQSQQAVVDEVMRQTTEASRTLDSISAHGSFQKTEVMDPSCFKIDEVSPGKVLIQVDLLFRAPPGVLASTQDLDRFRSGQPHWQRQN